MRDLLVMIIVLGSAPVAFFSPYYGLLVWTWISFFNPHRFAWGIAYNFPVGEVIAVPTLIGLMFASDSNRKIFKRETFLLLALWMWFLITFLVAKQTPLFADHIDEGLVSLEMVSKILLMTLITMVVVTTLNRLKWLLIVVGMSFGLLGIKGALFGLQTGGIYRVMGPPSSFVADNNDLALAINMSLPILFFLAREEKKKALRTILWIAFFASIGSVLLTYSRGGLLGLAVVLGVLAIKAKRKLLATSFLVAASLLVVSYAPQNWMERMQTFLAGDLDASAQGRINAWKFSWNLAMDYPVTGGGFGTFSQDLFERYAPDPTDFHGPHSIYFQMLAEQGFVGLTLMLLLLGSVLYSLRRLRKKVQQVPTAHSLGSYSHALETGLYAFIVSGAFLGRAYFDLWFQFIACVVLLKIFYDKERLRQAEEQELARSRELEEEVSYAT
jgi:probable O-glycosylation ligase (exosortase A-associated)